MKGQICLIQRFFISKAKGRNCTASLFGISLEIGVVLFLMFALNMARSQAAPVAPNPSGITINTNVDDPAEPVKDSLSERGSHNFSDMGSWIWDTNVCDRQTVRFWKSFEIPADTTVNRARLRITADNEYILYLDGREIGRDAEWRHLYEYDITSLLSPGNHVLAVEAYNSSREAGFMFGMKAGLSSGKVVEVKSDTSWLIVPLDVSWMGKEGGTSGFMAASDL
jgi:hypothetical protein